MALLASHLQVHDGLIVAIVRALIAAGGVATTERLQKLLQPPAVDQRPELLNMACDACEWFDIAIREGDQLRLSAEYVDGEHVARWVRSGLVSVPDESDRATDTQQGDLARALAWVLAQDSWNPPPDYEKVEGSVEDRQNRQFPQGPVFLNPTKWPSTKRWALFLGLAELDPVDSRRLIPDVTRAVRAELQTTERDSWTAREFIEMLGAACPVLDGGQTRAVALRGAAAAELSWEADPAVISPSLSVALLRLERGGILELERAADAPETERRSLTQPGRRRTIDQIKKVPA